MDILSHMIECARNAGAIAMSHFRDSHGIDVHNKVNDSDIVTIADKECETFIINHIKTNFPGHAILSEESGATSGVEDYRWVIDPIDGTTNFFSGIPIWAISIGLEHHGEREAGVVFLPATEELLDIKIS